MSAGTTPTPILPERLAALDELAGHVETCLLDTEDNLRAAKVARRHHAARLAQEDIDICRIQLALLDGIREQLAAAEGGLAMPDKPGVDARSGNGGRHTGRGRSHPYGHGGGFRGHGEPRMTGRVRPRRPLKKELLFENSGSGAVPRTRREITRRVIAAATGRVRLGSGIRTNSTSIKRRTLLPGHGVLTYKPPSQPTPIRRRGSSETRGRPAERG